MNETSRTPHALVDLGPDKRVRLDPGKGFDASKVSAVCVLCRLDIGNPMALYGRDRQCPLYVNSGLSVALGLLPCLRARRLSVLDLFAPPRYPP